MNDCNHDFKTLIVELTPNLQLIVKDPQAEDPEAPISAVSIHKGQSVRWQFTGLSHHISSIWVPSISFADGSPFGVLRQTADAIEGLDNDGRMGSFPFKACLQAWDGARQSRLFSAPILLWQEAVSIDVEVDLATWTWKIDPKLCAIEAGTPVLWRFPVFEENLRAEIRFGGWIPQGEETPRSVETYFGPFTAFSYLDGNILGTGSAPKGRYAYLVQVTLISAEDRQIELKSGLSDDPVIDSEQEPGSGGGGAGPQV